MEEQGADPEDLFPLLRDRRHQLAGTMSGGEQQMLTIGRALMTGPALLCMDEPSMGLAPRLVEEVFDIIQAINEQGTTVFVIEQNVNIVLSIAHGGYVLQMDEIVLSGALRSSSRTRSFRERISAGADVAALIRTETLRLA
jgi:branched-chain amino acid transport system ATP-binding protein